MRAYSRAVDLTEYIGCEVSVPVSGSRRRLRGWVGELAGNGGLLVRIYGDAASDNVYEIDQVRQLKAKVLGGWRAINVITEAGAPLFSMRLRTKAVAMIERYSAARGVDFETGFNMLLGEQIARFEAELAAA